METSYNSLRLVELRAPARERELQDYYRLKKAELTALPRSMSSTAPGDVPQDNGPMPIPLVSIKSRPRSIDRP